MPFTTKSTACWTAGAAFPANNLPMKSTKSFRRVRIDACFKNGVILRSGPPLAATKDLLFGPSAILKHALVL